MKSHISVLLIALLLGTITSAQETTTPKPNYAKNIVGGGVRLGASSLGQNGNGNSFSKLGFGYGADFEYIHLFSKSCGFKTGIAFMQNNSMLKIDDGFAYTNTQSAVTGGKTVTVDYTYTVSGQNEAYSYMQIALPLMFHFQKGSFYGDAGVRVNFPLSAIHANYNSGTTRVTIDRILPTGNDHLSNTLGARTYNNVAGEYEVNQPLWISAAGEAGVRIPLSPSSTMKLGVYGEWAVNQQQQTSNTPMRVVDIDEVLSWSETNNMKYVNCFHNDLIRAMRYFNFGFRLGFDFGKNTSPAKKIEAKPELAEQKQDYNNTKALFANDNAPEPNDLMIFIRGRGDKDEYFTSYASNGNWGGAQPMMQMGDPNDKLSSYTISPDGQLAVVSIANDNGTGGKDLYYCKKIGDQWSTPMSLGNLVNSNGEDFQPSFAPDGRTLYFVSNRVGGMGGNDIWMTTLLPDGTWSEATNMGSAINTPGNEQSPIYYNDQLYFASNGREGAGGYDIYYMEITNDPEPYSVGESINTDADEKGILMITSTSSEQVNNPLVPNQQLISLIQNDVLLRGLVVDEQTRLPINAHIYVTNEDGSAVLAATDNDLKSGEFYVSLSPNSQVILNVSSEQHVLYSIPLILDETACRNVFIAMESYGAPEFEYREEIHTPANNGAGCLPGDIIHTVNFSIGKNDITADSKNGLVHLATFLQEHPGVRVELGGHADNTGGEERNIILSWHRAKMVYEYLLGLNVSESQLTYHGYGSSMPIDTNATPEGRANNRRTDVVVVE